MSTVYHKLLPHSEEEIRQFLLHLQRTNLDPNGADLYSALELAGSETSGYLPLELLHVTSKKATDKVRLLSDRNNLTPLVHATKSRRPTTALHHTLDRLLPLLFLDAKRLLALLAHTSPDETPITLLQTSFQIKLLPPERETADERFHTAFEQLKKYVLIDTYGYRHRVVIHTLVRAWHGFQLRWTLPRSAMHLGLSHRSWQLSGQVGQSSRTCYMDSGLTLTI